MRNTPLKGMLNAASPIKKAPKPKKEVIGKTIVSPPKKGHTTRIAGGGKLTESN